MTSIPFFSTDATVSVADFTYVRSGVLALSNGVGTQMNATSQPPSSDGSEVAENRPSDRSAATRDGATSSMWLAPPFSSDTTGWETSNPTVGNPASANDTANGRPTYPRPTTPTTRSRRPTRSAN